jgi:hypothetical protein
MMNRHLTCIVLIIFAACSAQKNIPASKPVAVAVPAKDTTIAVKTEIKKPEKKTFNLQLVLALNASHYLETDSLGNAAYPDLDPLSETSLHFYEGMLLAAQHADSSIHLSVTDAANDSVKVLKLLKEKKYRESDLVIAILNPALNAMAAVASTEAGYSLLIPQHNTSSVLYGNKRTWLGTPSNKTQCRQMASYIQLTQPSAVFRFIYREGNKKEADLADLFYSEMISLGVDSGNCRKINYAVADGWGAIQKNWKEGKRNVLFIPMSDESILTSLFKKLDTHDQSEVMLVGLPTWELFETIDFTLLETLNTHIFSTTYIDYENEKVKLFRKDFIEEYHADPALSAFAGYDYYNWIAANVNKHGNKIEEYESIPALLSPVSGYRFRQLCPTCGYENQYFSVLKFQNGKLVKVNN